jgi:hypothetical protein
VPWGYDQGSPDPKRPRGSRGPLQRGGWLVALVDNAVADVAAAWAGGWEGGQLRTMRRTFLKRPGKGYGTPTALVVHGDPLAGQEALEPVIDRCKAAGHRIPGLENRRVGLSWTARRRDGPSPSRLIINK